MARNYTPIPDDFLEEMGELSDAEYGRLIRWCQAYNITGEQAGLSGNERFYLRRCKNQIDRFNANYDETVEKRREAGKAGGLAKSSKGKQTVANASTTKQMLAKDSKCQETKTKTKTKTSYIEANASCAEPEEFDTAPPVISLPLNDGSEYGVSLDQCQEWAGLYPAVDVMQQLREMRGWLLSNPGKRKTKRGILRFITGWLSREQDKGGIRGGSVRQNTGYVSGGDRILEMMQRGDFD